MGSSPIDLTGLPAIGNLTNAIRNGPSQGNSGQIWVQNAQALDTLDSNFQSVAQAVTELFGSSSSSSSTGFAWASFNAGSGTSFSPNFAQGSEQEFTLTGNGTIGPATGGTPGMPLVIVLVQDATGGRQISSWDASYLFPGTFGLDPTPNTATTFFFMVNSKGHLFLTCAPVTGTPWP